MMRPGSAGSSTAAGRLQVLEEAVAALPPVFRRRLMVTCDGPGASHDLVKHMDKLASRRGYKLVCSVGWALGEREKAALALVPQTAGRPRSTRRGRPGNAVLTRPAGTAGAGTVRAGPGKRTSPS
jgi:hypothetical protein